MKSIKNYKIWPKNLKIGSFNVVQGLIQILLRKYELYFHWFCKKRVFLFIDSSDIQIWAGIDQKEGKIITCIWE
jgi:hypothetical protein